MNSWRKIEPNLLILSLKDESRWVCVTKSSNSYTNSSMLLKMKKNKIEGEYSFESDILILMYEKSEKFWWWLHYLNSNEFCNHGLRLCNVTLENVGCWGYRFIFYYYFCFILIPISWWVWTWGTVSHKGDFSRELVYIKYYMNSN